MDVDWSLNKNELVNTEVEDSIWQDVQQNVLNPALNSSVVEMWNMVAITANSVSEKLGGHDLLHPKHELPVEHTKFLSSAWLVQSVSSGLAMLLPYTVAGKSAHGLLKGTSTRLGLSDNVARFVENEALSSVVGAAVYDGLRETKPGESHMGNAIGGAAAFGTFAIGGEISRNMSTAKMLAVRTMAGALGGVTQHAILGISTSRIPSLEEFGKASVNGMVMSIILPESQRALKSLAKQSNETLKMTVPMYEAINRRIPTMPEFRPKPVPSEPVHTENVDFFVKNETLSHESKSEGGRTDGKNDRGKDERVEEIRRDKREGIPEATQSAAMTPFSFSSNSEQLSPREGPPSDSINFAEQLLPKAS